MAFRVEEVESSFQLIVPVAAQNEVILSFPFLFSLILVHVAVLCVGAKLRLIMFPNFSMLMSPFLLNVLVLVILQVSTSVLLFLVRCLSFQS